MSDEQPVNPQQPDTIVRSVTNVVRRTEAALSPWVRRWWQPDVGAPAARAPQSRATASGAALSSAGRTLPLTLRVQRTPHALVDRFSQGVVERHAQAERIGRRYRRESAPEEGSPAAALPLPGVNESRPAAPSAPNEMSLDELAATFQPPPEMAAAGEETVQRAVDPTLGAMSPSPERFAEIQAARRAAQRRAGADSQPAAAVQRTPAAEASGPNQSIAAQIEARIRAARAQRQAASGAPAAPASSASTPPAPTPMRPPFGAAAAQPGDATGDAVGNAAGDESIQRSPAAQPQPPQTQPSASMPQPAQEPSPLPDSVPATVQRVSGSGDEQVQVPEELAQTPTAEPEGEGYSRSAAIAERIRQARVQREAEPPASPSPRPALRTSTDPESPRFSRTAVIAERVRAAREQRVRGEAPVQRQVSPRPGDARYSRAAEMRERLEAQRARRRAQASGQAPSQVTGDDISGDDITRGDGPDAAQTPSEAQQGAVQRDTVQQDTVQPETVQRTPEEAVNQPASEPPVEPPSGGSRPSEAPADDGPNLSIARAIEARLQAARAQRAAASRRAGGGDAQADAAPPPVQRSTQQGSSPHSSPTPPDPPSNPGQGPAQEPPAASMTDTIRRRMEAMRAHQQGRAMGDAAAGTGQGDAGPAPIQRSPVAGETRTPQAVPPAVEPPTALPTPDAPDVTPVARPAIMREFKPTDPVPGAVPRARAFSRSQVLTPERKTGDFLADESKPSTPAPAPAPTPVPVQRTPAPRPAQGLTPGSTSQHTGEQRTDEEAAGQTGAPALPVDQPAQTDSAIQRMPDTQAAPPLSAPTEGAQEADGETRAAADPELIHPEMIQRQAQAERPLPTLPDQAGQAGGEARAVDAPTPDREASSEKNRGENRQAQPGADAPVQRAVDPAVEATTGQDQHGATPQESRRVSGAQTPPSEPSSGPDAPSTQASQGTVTPVQRAVDEPGDAPAVHAEGAAGSIQREPAASSVAGEPVRGLDTASGEASAEAIPETRARVDERVQRAAVEPPPGAREASEPSTGRMGEAGPVDGAAGAVQRQHETAPDDALLPSAAQSGAPQVDAPQVDTPMLDAPSDQIARSVEPPSSESSDSPFRAPPTLPTEADGEGTANAPLGVSQQQTGEETDEAARFDAPSDVQRAAVDDARSEAPVQSTPEAGEDAPAIQRRANVSAAPSAGEPAAPQRPGRDHGSRTPAQAAVDVQRSPDSGASASGQGASDQAAAAEESALVPQERGTERVQRMAATPTDAPEPGTGGAGVSSGADAGASAAVGVQRAVNDATANNATANDVTANDVIANDVARPIVEQETATPTVEQAGAEPLQRVQRQATEYDAPEGAFPARADAVDATPDVEAGVDSGTGVEVGADAEVPSAPASSALVQRATKPADGGSPERGVQRQAARDGSTPGQAPEQASDASAGAIQRSVDGAQPQSSTLGASTPRASTQPTSTQPASTQPPGQPSLQPSAQAETTQAEAAAQEDSGATIQRTQAEAVQRDSELQGGVRQGDVLQEDARGGDALQERAPQEGVAQDRVQRDTAQGGTAQRDTAALAPRSVQEASPLSSSGEPRQPGEHGTIQRETVQRDTIQRETAPPQADTRADGPAEQTTPQADAEPSRLPAIEPPVIEPRRGEAGDSPPAASSATIQRAARVEPVDSAPPAAVPPAAARSGAGRGEAAIRRQSDGDAGGGTPALAHVPRQPLVQRRLPGPILSRVPSPVVLPQVQDAAVASLSSSGALAGAGLGLSANTGAAVVQRTVEPSQAAHGETAAPRWRGPAKQAMPLAAPRKVAQGEAAAQPSSRPGATVQRAPVQRVDVPSDVEEQESREAEAPHEHDEMDAARSPAASALEAPGAPESGDSGGSGVGFDDERTAEAGRQRGRPSADLDTLARALLPVIKRMLVIERERRPVR